MKRILIVICSILLVLCGCNNSTEEENVEEEPNEEVVEAQEEPKEDYKLLYFEDEKTIWGADPGLGIDVLHKLGYKGKGSIIAYCDGKIKLDHEQFKEADIIYEDFPAGERMEWHGYAVLSLLLGKDIGTAPETRCYYFGYEPSNDQQKMADVIDEVIRVNNTLPEDEKIMMLGFSNNIYRVGPDRINQQVGIDAAQRCRDAGIMIFFCGENGSLYYKDGTNRNDPESCYNVPQWANEMIELCKVPAASRSFAKPGNKYGYDDEYNPGMSWTMPYSLGVYAIAMSIDPTLTEKDIRTLIVQTAFYNSRGMRIINPCEFIAVVLERVGRNEDADELRKAYQNSLTNYDENKYAKLQLDPALKPFDGKVVKKNLRPNNEILSNENLISPRTNFYCDSSRLNSDYEITNCKISTTSDGKLTIAYSVKLPKGMKAHAYNCINEKAYSSKLDKTNGKLQDYIINLMPKDYRDMDTLRINYADKDNEFDIYIDIFSFQNPIFEEITEDIKFTKEDYNYEAKSENEFNYSYDRSLLSENYVNINNLTYYEKDDNTYDIKVNLTTSDDMAVCLFNPPNGNIIMLNNNVEKYKTTDIVFNVEKEKISKVDTLMISIYKSDTDRAFVQLDITPLK